MKLQSLCLAVGIVVGFCAATSASGKQVTIAASEVHRVVNPRNAEDVRVFCRFVIPEELRRSYIVRAFLALPTTGEGEIPLAVVEMDQPWSGQDSWEALDSRFGNRLASAEQAVFVGSNEAGVFQIPLSASTRRWGDSRRNYGVCVLGYPGRRDNTAGVLGAQTSTPELTIVYVRKSQSP
jgi:hypothetical protein